MVISFTAFIGAFLSAYLIGSIPTGYILTKIFKGIDIRKAGSSNVGATNVFRTAGKIPGLITLIIDVLKGVIVVTVIAGFFYQFLSDIDHDFYLAFLGLSVISGHVWTIFLRFKGGKGVATTIGVLMVIAPKALLFSLIIWVIFFSITKYVSAASIGFNIFLPLFATLLGQSFYTIIFAIIICCISTYKHKDNIKRLLKGEENKTFIWKRRDNGSKS